MRKRDQVKKKIENTVGKILGNKERNDVIKYSFETSLKVLKESSDFNPILKSAVGGICASLEIIHQKTKNKVKMTEMTRDLAAKGQELDSLNGQGNSSEVEDQIGILARKLDSIDVKLREKLEHSPMQRALQADHDAQDIENYCQELQAAYEECRTQILFKVERDTTKILKTLMINKLEYSVLAFHNVASMNRSQCTEGTRVEILNDIMKWAEDCSSDTLLGYWMCGMAGTGKSTIAKSLCLKLEEKELLAGSFFCSRQVLECRRDSKIIPTIAYQLAQYSCTFAQELSSALEHDQDLAQKEPSIQVEKLLIQPWKTVIKAKKFQGSSPVVVIDALDECENISRVLKVIVTAIQQKKMEGLKFFFTSRPEGNISDHLNTESKTSVNKKPHVHTFYLHNVEESLVQDDIQKFLREQLQPFLITERQLQILVQQSGKLFIYAATTAKYVTNAHGFEKKRLQNVLNLGNAPNKMQTERIDELYGEILENSCNQWYTLVKQTAKFMHFMLLFKIIYLLGKGAIAVHGKVCVELNLINFQCGMYIHVVATHYDLHQK
ncbi:hypothetical protein K435DRAFT_840185 [Dendrothele bispora CBS 962.96]|uniref:Nephrocystin 3-like N-terminal domain-containing protein n=1 Tax=Dendrothele bispora (strain CBS 962.96) TaxID=1314807 RepID=A0A4S8LVE6_DENBC|nr:hypothetical protein K435DRAFT_840185 [Dendrothele bispora CBS 962.96]